MDIYPTILMTNIGPLGNEYAYFAIYSTKLYSMVLFIVVSQKNVPSANLKDLNFLSLHIKKMTDISEVRRYQERAPNLNWEKVFGANNFQRVPNERYPPMEIIATSTEKNNYTREYKFDESNIYEILLERRNKHIILPLKCNFDVVLNLDATPLNFSIERVFR